jgi:signal transduction histidine kinase
LAPLALFPVALTVLLLAGTVWRARPASPINRWFAAFSLLVAAWTFCVANLHTTQHYEVWGRLAFATAASIPVAFLAFIRWYPTLTGWPSIMVVRGALLVAVLLGAASLLTPLVVHDVVLTEEGISRGTGPLYPFFAAFFVFAFTTSIVALIKKWHCSRGLARAQLHYLGVAIVVSTAGGALLNLFLPLITGNSTYTWAGPYFSLPLVAIVGHAVVRHRLLDLRPIILRGVIYTIATLALALVIVVIVRFAILRTNSSSLTALPLAVVVLLAVLLLLSAPAQYALRRLIEPYLFRAAINYSEALRGATKRLHRLMRLEEFKDEFLTALDATFRPEIVLMFVRRDNGTALDSVGAGSCTDSASGLGRLLSRLVPELPSPAVLSLESDDVCFPRDALGTLRSTGTELIMTLGRRTNPLGVVLIGPRRSGDAYFASDLAYLALLADVASIALENALLYRQRIDILEYSNRLLESLDSAVVAADVTGRLTSFNAAASRLFGLAYADHVKTLDRLPSPIGWAMALALRSSWAVRDVEGTVDASPNVSLPVVFSTTVLHDASGSVSGALVVVTDLSHVKALERNQRRAEHLSTMTRFYAGIAHEIRTPLTSISNFVAMLNERFDDAEYREAASRIIPLEVARIVRLAERLRLMAPSQDALLRFTDLREVLTDVVALQEPRARERGVAIKLRPSPDPLSVMADVDQSVQLFVNLINNAIEAMPHGGTVIVDARRCNIRPDDDVVVVTVTDTGTGIAPQIRNKIFQPFFTTKTAGTGLGLAICREIADFHHAKLTVTPRGDVQGTVATLELKAYVGEADVVLAGQPDVPNILSRPGR